MFYLSPCNSFYILGLCSLASVQSQPRDTGLYQAHMCALLQLTHISSFVTVTKLARLRWEMCRLWLTAHVWILYFESHADLSNTGSVKASLTLLSSTGELQRVLTTFLNYLTLYMWVCEVEAEKYLTCRYSPVLLVPKLNLRSMSLACSLFSSVEEILGEKLNESFFMPAFWQDCLREGKKGDLYTLIRSVTKITLRKLFQ